MKQSYYIGYLFSLPGGAFGQGDIKMESESTGDKIELSWETMESFKEVIRDECEKHLNIRPTQVTIMNVMPLDEHDANVNITNRADINPIEETENEDK